MLDFSPSDSEGRNDKIKNLKSLRDLLEFRLIRLIRNYYIPRPKGATSWFSVPRLIAIIIYMPYQIIEDKNIADIYLKIWAGTKEKLFSEIIFAFSDQITQADKIKKR